MSEVMKKIQPKYVLNVNDSVLVDSNIIPIEVTELVKIIDSLIDAIYGLRGVDRE